jgi:membrane-bound lytic murein transglycosylase D
VQHTVKKSETLWSIASSYGVTVDEVKTWNSLKDDALRSGQVLKIFASETKMKQAVKTTAEKPAAEKVSAGKTAAVKHAAEPQATESSDAKGADEVAQTPGQHVVQPGESLYGISRKYGMSVEDLKKLNDLRGTALRTSQTLKVAKPESAATVAAPAAAAPQMSVVVKDGRKLHVVQEGETLYSIARAFNVTVEQLTKWNKLGSYIKKGQELLVEEPVK